MDQDSYKIILIEKSLVRWRDLGKIRFIAEPSWVSELFLYKKKASHWFECNFSHATSTLALYIRTDCFSGQFRNKRETLIYAYTHARRHLVKRKVARICEASQESSKDSAGPFEERPLNISVWSSIVRITAKCALIDTTAFHTHVLIVYEE